MAKSPQKLVIPKKRRTTFTEYVCRLVYLKCAVYFISGANLDLVRFVICCVVWVVVRGSRTNRVHTEMFYDTPYIRVQRYASEKSEATN